MTPEMLSETLRSGMALKHLNTQELARKAGVAYETARRAIQGSGGMSLSSTTKLLVAIDRELIARQKTS
jgi:DNA-binding phage protein